MYARWSKNGNLPEEYEQIEYIESTGTQYIDTGYLPKTNTKLELTVSFNGEFKAKNDYGVGHRIFGVIENSNQFSMNFGAASLQGEQIYIWNDKTLGAGASIYMLDDTYADVRYTKNTIVLENSKVTYGTHTQTLTPKSQNHTTETLKLFAEEIPFGSYNMRVYEMMISEGNDIVRHFIPCINPNGEAGLYDLVTNQFYENIGTGTFNVGHF